MSLSILSVPRKVMHCGNEISCVIKTSLPSSTANLKIMCWLQVELVYGSNVSVQLVNQTLDPNADGECTFFWHRFLWDAFENAFDLPATGSAAAYQLQNHIKKYNLWAIELSGSPQATTDIVNTGTLSETRYAVRGAMAKRHHLNLPFFGTAGLNQTALPVGLGMAFLDWRGSNPSTRLTQEQWLHWMWQDPGGVLGALPFNYKVKWYRSDGSTGTSTFLTTPTMQPYEVYGFPAGFGQLNLSANETATDKITKYETWVEVTILGTPIPFSEIKTWHVDRAYYEFVTEFQYLNSLGVMEQVALRGNRVQNMEIDRSEVTKYHQTSYGLQAGESLIYEQLVTNGASLESGNLNKDEVKQWMDFLASHKRFAMPSSQNVPIRITNKKAAYNSLVNNHRFTLDIVVDYNDTVPDLIF